MNSSEFVYINQPYYDADPYLFMNGFKFYWSYWTGHPNHMTMLELYNILEPLLQGDIIKRYCIYGVDKIDDSSNVAIHNIDSPVDQHGFDESKHTPKRFIKFDFPVYKETAVIIDISGTNTEWIESRTFQTDKIYDSNSGYITGQKFVIAKRPVYIRVLRKIRNNILEIIR